jgi:CRP/FNR family cyclic AMP-dependent transcriptional regulator
MRKVFYILGELSERDLEWIIATGRREEVTAGTILIQEGVPTDALYIVLDGMLTVSMAALGGREITTIGCGEVLGEMSFVDDRPPAATVKALENSLVLSIPRQPLAEKLQQDVLFALRFYRAITKFLSTRLRGAVNWFSEDKEARSNPDSPELDLTLQPPEDMTLAKSRFENLLQRLKEV